MGSNNAPWIQESSITADSMQSLIRTTLRDRGELTDTLAPSRIVQNWPPHFAEWSTRAVRDAVFSSHTFPRLSDMTGLTNAFVRGVADGQFGYAAKRAGDVIRIVFEDQLIPQEIEYGDDTVLVLPETARSLKAAAPSPEAPITTDATIAEPSREAEDVTDYGEERVDVKHNTVAKVVGQAHITPNDYTRLYLRVISQLVAAGDVGITVTFTAAPLGGIARERVDRVRDAARELGIDLELKVTESPEDG